MMLIRFIFVTSLFFCGLARADDIARAESWFNELSTYQARFIQVSSDGSHATGEFSFRRPHLVRFDYDDPVMLTLITTELWLHVDDASEREVTSYPISETPLGLLLSDPVVFRGKDVSTRSRVEDGVVLVTLENDSAEALGRVVLEFTDSPFELRRWILTDSAGITTSILLTDSRKGLDLPGRLFVPTDYPDGDETQ